MYIMVSRQEKWFENLWRIYYFHKILKIFWEFTVIYYNQKAKQLSDYFLVSLSDISMIKMGNYGCSALSVIDW
jgi:hypothetical protein